MNGKVLNAFCEWEGLFVRGKVKIIGSTEVGGRIAYDCRLIGDKFVKAVKSGASSVYVEKDGRVYESTVVYSKGNEVCLSGLKPSLIDNRQAPRVSVPLTEGECTVEVYKSFDKKTYKGRILDLSETGIGLAVPKEAAKDLTYETEFVVVWPARGFLFKLPAKVKNVREGEEFLRIGAQIHSLDQLTLKNLRKFLQERQREIARLL